MAIDELGCLIERELLVREFIPPFERREVYLFFMPLVVCETDFFGKCVLTFFIALRGFPRDKKFPALPNFDPVFASLPTLGALAR